jgi:hypothetical protein
LKDLAEFSLAVAVTAADATFAVARGLGPRVDFVFPSLAHPFALTTVYYGKNLRWQIVYF